MSTTVIPARRPPATIPVTAFVDWAAQMHNTDTRAEVPVLERARRALAQTARLIRRALSNDHGRFQVSFRLYHGWHRGWERTDHLKAAQAIENEGFAALTSPRVSFSPEVQYGHTLISALPERQHRNPPIHLPNTLREQSRGQPPTEKMVDTAMAADLLSWARFRPQEWALVLSEDDDLVPPLFTAEAWVKHSGGRALLVRKRGPSQYTKLDGLLRQFT